MHHNLPCGANVRTLKRPRESEPPATSSTLEPPLSTPLPQPHNHGQYLSPPSTNLRSSEAESSFGASWSPTPSGRRLEPLSQASSGPAAPRLLASAGIHSAALQPCGASRYVRRPITRVWVLSKHTELISICTADLNMLVSGTYAYSTRQSLMPREPSTQTGSCLQTPKPCLTPWERWLQMCV